jgi:hypothetical protein
MWYVDVPEIQREGVVDNAVSISHPAPDKTEPQKMGGGKPSVSRSVLVGSAVKPASLVPGSEYWLP